MKTIKFFNKLPLLALAALISLTSCKKDEDDTDYPDAEHDHEVITDVILHFEDSEGHVVEAHAQDKDGEGAEGLVVIEDIELEANTEYSLSLEIFNNSEHDHDEEDKDNHENHEGDDHDSEGEDIGAEILEEGAEHQIFFEFTDNAFSSPLGNGNIDNAKDPLNYNDEDKYGNPIGLKTKWTTRGEALSENGKFRVRLMHQPEVKTESSDSNTGDVDFDIVFELKIKTVEKVIAITEK